MGRKQYLTAITSWFLPCDGELKIACFLVRFFFRFNPNLTYLDVFHIQQSS